MEPTGEGLIDVAGWPEVTGAGRSPGRDRMTAALRAAQDAAHGTAAPDEVAGQVASILEEALAALRPFETVAGQGGWDLPGPRAQSTISPPLTDVRAADGKVRATVTFSAQHHGSNGAVHGGSIPLLFDDFLGRMVSAAGVRARTAWLRVDYRHVTPVNQPLELSAWIAGIDGRKYSVLGELHAGGLLTAEATSLFVALRPGAQ
jgi:acyl-coenzyme A thioesterase PaaI-like protein